MREPQKFIFAKPTIISIIGLIIILIGLPYGIYGLNLDGGASLGGVLTLVGVFIVVIIFIIDRVAVEKINYRNLNIIEGILLIVLTSVFFINNQKIIFDISQNNSNYFVLIENNGMLNNTELKYSFPFNKKISTGKNNSVINSIEENYQKINIQSPTKWNGMRMQPGSFNKTNIQFYSNPKIEFSEKQIDSIIELELKALVN
jgi:hypothetical protein